LGGAKQQIPPYAVAFAPAPVGMTGYWEGFGDEVLGEIQ